MTMVIGLGEMQARYADLRVQSEFHPRSAFVRHGLHQTGSGPQRLHLLPGQRTALHLYPPPEQVPALLPTELLRHEPRHRLSLRHEPALRGVRLTPSPASLGQGATRHALRSTERHHASRRSQSSHPGAGRACPLPTHFRQSPPREGAHACTAVARCICHSAAIAAKIFGAVTVGPRPSKIASTMSGASSVRFSTRPT